MQLLTCSAPDNPQLGPNLSLLLQPLHSLLDLADGPGPFRHLFGDNFVELINIEARVSLDQSQNLDIR